MSSLMDVGLREALKYNQVNCIITQNVNFLATEEINYDQCQRPIKLCSGLKFKNKLIQNSDNILNGIITADVKAWKTLTGYNKDGILKTELLKENVLLLWQLNLFGTSTGLKACKSTKEYLSI